MSTPVGDRSPDASARSRSHPVPTILVVAEDFRSLVEPLTWLYEAGYDVRACLGPLAADRVCGLFDEGCAELAASDLLITNESPHPPSRVLPPRREVVREARLRREELPILLVCEDPDPAAATARSMTTRVTSPEKTELLEAVRAMVGAPPAEGAER